MSDLEHRPSLSALSRRTWDVVVVGGGITGAGILREAVRAGLDAVLVERNDFASGTSSRSSKLVHGGLQYLARLELGLARSAIHQREKLVGEGGELVRSLGFVLLVRRGDHRTRCAMQAVLTAYNLLAGRRRLPARLSRETLRRHLPGLDRSVATGFVYREAVTDDAGLVLRVLREACERGGRAVNYMEAVRPLRGPGGGVAGIAVRDLETGLLAELRARAVVNATGPWADGLRRQLGRTPRLRWIRGSHLVLARGASSRLAVGGLHPTTGRPVYLIPWEGRTLVGSTHVDAQGPGGAGGRIAPEEVRYLLEAAQSFFPRLGIGPDDVISTFTGVRPVVDRRADDPARASREHAVWTEEGLLTVTGGKLTTFQAMGREVLDRLAERFPGMGRPVHQPPALEPPLPLRDLLLPPGLARRLRDRYGIAAVETLARGAGRDREVVGALRVSKGELGWIARNEAVMHLDDLLLRRVRIGLVARRGGLPWMEEIRRAVQPSLGWDDARWAEEAAAYRRLWFREHAPSGWDRDRAFPARRVSRYRRGAGRRAGTTATRTVSAPPAAD